MSVPAEGYLAGVQPPAITYNDAADEFLVVWPHLAYRSPEPRGPSRYLVRGQRLTATGALTGVTGFRVSATWTTVARPAVSFSSFSQEYLVAWSGQAGPAESPSDAEIYSRRVNSDGTLHTSEFQLSDMGPPGNQTYFASYPAIASSRTAAEHLVVWHGEDDTTPLVAGEAEIFRRRYSLPDPFGVGLGSWAGEGGWLSTHGDGPALAAQGWAQVLWSAYNATGGGTHPAMGDLDGDGRDEVVLGLDADGQRWLAILDDSAAGYATLRWLQLPWPAFNTPLYPAAGDVDGDGVDEIVVGLGPGTNGWFAILDDVLADVPSIAWERSSGRSTPQEMAAAIPPWATSTVIQTKKSSSASEPGRTAG